MNAAHADLQKLLGFIDSRLAAVAPEVELPANDDLQAALQTHFGLSEFRPHQQEIIETILDKKNILAVLPTGYGKSLCYQLPALMDGHSPLEGGHGGGKLSIVVSPLIALMKDQVEHLRELGHTQAAYINSLLTLAQQRAVMAQVQRGEIKLLYIAPERFRSRAFTEELKQRPLRLFVVDEAHCISQWGHDFRPDYLALREAIRFLQPDSLALFTATVTPEVEGDLLRQLGIEGIERFMTSPVRPNLRFRVIRTASETEKFRVLARLAEQLPGKGIIYVARKHEAVEVASFLQHLGRRADFYHAGRNSEERRRVQDAFFDDGPQGVDIIAATNAFGLGIDKHNLRFVIHFTLPGTLEAYYQEAGRAGRDGKQAECILFFCEEDTGLQRWFIKQSLITKKDMLRVYAAVERAPGYYRFRWIDRREVEWQSGCDQTTMRVVLSYLQRLGFLRQHPNISRVLTISHVSQMKNPPLAPPGRGIDPAGLPKLTPRLDTLHYCKQQKMSPLTLMERLYDARWQGFLQFHGAEECQLIECLRPSQELQGVTNDQLGMKDFERQKRRQLDQMILYAVTPNCRQQVIRSYFGEAIDNNEVCDACDVCNPALRLDISSDATTRQLVGNYLQQRETPKLNGSHLDGGFALAFHTTVFHAEHVRTDIGERVYNFKYGNDLAQADLLAAQAAKALEEQGYLDRFDLVAAVPGTLLHGRNYDPVPVFAEKLCDQLEKPYIPALRKTRRTKPQKAMHTLEQKLRNVRDAFAVTNRSLLTARRVLLVDDLFDSGATLNECARVLKQAGAKTVYVFTLTKTSHVAK